MESYPGRTERGNAWKFPDGQGADAAPPRLSTIRPANLGKHPRPLFWLGWNVYQLSIDRESTVFDLAQICANLSFCGICLLGRNGHGKDNLRKLHVQKLLAPEHV